MRCVPNSSYQRVTSQVASSLCSQRFRRTGRRAIAPARSSCSGTHRQPPVSVRPRAGLQAAYASPAPKKI
eukprot:2024482-Prymnesium_polylepis.1